MTRLFYETVCCDARMLAYTKRAANLTALEVWKRRFAAMCHATSRISLNFRSLRPDSVSDNQADNQRQKIYCYHFHEG